MLVRDDDFVINEQYKIVIRQQLEEVDEGQRKMQLLFSEYLKTAANHFGLLNNIVKKINNIYISQLMGSKGLVYDIQQKQQGLTGKDLSKIIEDVNSLINKNIEFHSLLEAIIKSEIGNKFPPLTITASVIEETIEQLYTALRDLKKANKKTSVSTSDLAKDTALRSAKALEKVIHAD